MEKPFYKDSFLLVLLGAVLAVKLLLLAWIVFQNPLGAALFEFPDSAGYLFPAKTLLTHGTFYDFIPRLPLTFRTPGYPLFLALIYALGGNNSWVCAAQTLLAALLLIPVYKTAFMLSGRTAARGAALLTALSVLYTVYAYAVLAEILFVFLIAWSVYFFTRFLLKLVYTDLLYCALLLVASIYVRPVAYYLPFCLFALLAVFKQLFKLRLSLTKCAVLLIIPALLLLGGWNLRNKIQTGFGGFTTGTNYNIYFWNLDWVAHTQKITFSQASEALMKKRPENFEQLPLSEQDAWYGREGRILARNAFFFKVKRIPFWLGKTLFGNNFVHTSRVLTGLPGLGQQSETYLLNNTQLLAKEYLQTFRAKLIFIASLAQTVGLFVLAVIGIWICWTQKGMPRLPFYFLLCYAAYFLVLSSLFFGAHSRYRAPFEFIFCLFGGVGLAKIYEKFRRAR